MTGTVASLSDLAKPRRFWNLSQQSLAMRTLLVTGAMLTGFSLVVGGLSAGVVLASRAVFPAAPTEPLAATPGAGESEAPVGADSASPAARPGTKTAARSKKPKGSKSATGDRSE